MQVSFGPKCLVTSPAHLSPKSLLKKNSFLFFGLLFVWRRFCGFGPWRLLLSCVHGLLLAVMSLVADRGLKQFWHTGLAAPRHMRSSRTRVRTCVSCVGRPILNHRATRDARPCCKGPVFSPWLPLHSLSGAKTITETHEHIS